MKKLVSLLLALILVCAALPALAEDTSVVTLDVFMSNNRSMNDATNLTRQYMIDNIGVDLNLIQGDGSTFDQQLALYITDKNMPDVVHCSYTAWKGYVGDGAWADIAPYLNAEDYPYLMEYVGDNWSYMMEDGAIYGIPSVLGVPTNYVIDIRKDWLDNLNLEIPVTIEDFTNVMRAFTNDDPDGDGQKNTYGLSAPGYTYLSFLMGAFGASAERQFFLNEDDTITTNAISEQLKDALYYLRDIYAEGLIDPEMFTASSIQSFEKWGRGEMGIWSNNWNRGGDAYSKYDFANTQPGAEVEIIMPPVGENGLSGNMSQAPFSKCLGVSYQCAEEEIKAALRLLNFQASPLGWRIVMYGMEDEFFTYDEETNMTTWYFGVNNSFKSKSGKYETSDMEVYKLLYHEDWQAQSYKLSDDIVNRMLSKGSDMRFEQPVLQDVFNMFMSEERLEYQSELDKYFKQNILAFIMGDKDLDTEWDSYVQEYLNMGGEAERQGQLRLYNETFGTNCTFAE